MPESGNSRSTTLAEQNIRTRLSKLEQELEATICTRLLLDTRKLLGELISSDAVTLSVFQLRVELLNEELISFIMERNSNAR